MSYTPDIIKFQDGGLNLNSPVDLVPKGQYSRFTNAISKVEGTLQQRDGTTKICTIENNVLSRVNSIFRLTQTMPGTSSERLAGTSTGNLYSLIDPPGNSPSLLSGPMFDGNPLSIISFLFTLDPLPWAIIANANGMMKHRPGYYQNLGIDPPTAAATATVGGTGLLDSSGGIPYDWRYTYYNAVSGSESNPSPINVAGGSVEVTAPTSFTNPDPSYLPTAFSNPANAFDGNPLTFSGGTGPDTSSTTQYASCRWKGWAPGSGLNYTSLVLTVIATSSTTVTQTGQPNHTGPGGGTIQYSLDGGTTWVSMTQNAGNSYTASLPPYTNLLQIEVRAFAPGVKAVINIPHQPITITSSTTVLVYEIYATGIVAAGTQITLGLTNQSANVCVTPSTDTQVNFIRLYREGGTLPAGVWFLVNSYPVSSLSQGVCGSGTLQINDNIPDIQIENNPVLQFTNNHPVASVQANDVNLPVIWGPYPESTPMVLGCGDPARPNAVYFSQVGNADEWPPQNFLFVGPPDEPMQSGCVYDTRCYAYTTESIYTLLSGIIQGATFSPFRTASKRGLYSRWGLCVGSKGMYFIAKDGIYVSKGGPEQSIVEKDLRPLFPKQDAPNGVDTNGYFAPDYSQPNLMRLRYHNSEVWFGYIGLTDQNRHWMIYDEMRDRWRAYERGDAIETVYSEPSVTSLLLLSGADGDLYQGGGSNDEGTSISVTIRTGAFDQGIPLKVKEYGNALFDVDPGGATITVTPYINGDVLANSSLTITGSGRNEFSLSLSDVLARNISFDIQWTGGNPVFYQLTIMHRLSATAMQHWEIPPTSHTLSGWQHVRDLYVSIRTNAAVTLVVTPDTGSPQTLTIPNTSNTKMKIYLPLQANKGKLYSYNFNSTAPFQLYQAETEIRAKQWNTAMGYQIIPILGAETPPADTTT